MIQGYKNLRGPSLQVIEANEDIKIVEEKVCNMILTQFPILARYKFWIILNIFSVCVICHVSMSYRFPIYVCTFMNIIGRLPLPRIAGLPCRQLKNELPFDELLRDANCAFHLDFRCRCKKCKNENKILVIHFIVKHFFPFINNV